MVFAQISPSLPACKFAPNYWKRFHIHEDYELAILADAFARSVAFAISQPDEVDINEILF